MASRSTNPSLDRMAPSVNASISSRDRRRSSSTRPSEHRAYIKSQLFTSCICTVWVHEPPNFNTKDVVINPEVVNSLGGVSDSTELLELRTRSQSSDVNDDFYNDNSDAILNLNKNLNDHSPLNPQSSNSADPNGYSRKKRKGNNKRGSETDQKLVFRAVPALAEPELVLKQPQFQISVSRGIAAQHGFHNRMEVILSKVPRAPHTIDHVELYFRDQYVGRADMWRVTSLLEDTCVHVGQKVALAGSVRATVGRIFIKEGKVTSGYVSTSTKAIFRSESAKYDLFLQLSKEMWQFDEDGEMYFEKAIQGFIPELLRRWRSVPTNHVVSVVLFARVHYEESELHMLEDGIITSGGSSSLPLRRESDGFKRWYIDYYKVIVDLDSDCNWSDVFVMLKEEFFRFQHDILLLRRPESGPSHLANKEEIYSDLLRDRTILAGKLSYSNEGNVLEAINLALNSFDEHYIDRDLNRTGFSIVFVTAGTGHFEVDKRLLRITTERMIDNGIGLDLVCLTKMPLHSVPLFHFRSQVPDTEEEAAASASAGPGATSKGRRGTSFRGSGTGGQNQPSRQASVSNSAAVPAPPDPLYYDSTRKDSNGDDSLSDFYSMPHWIDCSFYSLQQDKPFRSDQFVPRCKMHEVQMMGVMENEISDIAIPYLDESVYPSSKKRPLSTTGSNTSSSFLASRFASGGGSGMGNSMDQSITGLDPKAARRLARERFDSNTLRDLDFPVPIPASRSQFLRKASSGGMGRSLPPSPTKSMHALGPPSGTGSNSNTSQGPGLNNATAGSTIKLSKPPRPSQVGRESNRSSIVLESHAEHPSSSEVEVEVPDSPMPVPPRRLRKRTSTDKAATALKNAQRHSQALSEIGAAPSRDRSRPPSPRFASRPVSRSGSLRSISTFSRTGLLKALEPLGKAPALVATADPALSEAVERYASTLSPPTLLSQDGLTPPASPARSAVTSVLSKHAGSSRGSTPSSKKSGYRLSTWGIWSSLTGSTEASSSASTASGAGSKEVEASATAASRRIQEMLGTTSTAGIKGSRSTSGASSVSQAASLVNSPMTKSPLPSEKDLSHQGPISIPSQVATGSTPAQSRLDNQAEAEILREQEAYEQRLEEEEAKARYAQRAQVEKQTLVNPSNPRKGISTNSSQLLRWQHLFPRRLNRHAVKWRSMTSPACLPLTTLYLPSESDLATHWQEYPHTLSVSSEMTSFLVKRHPSTPPALAMLREMASQRLAQGFQFIVPSFDPSDAGMNGVASSRSITSPRQFALRHPSELFQPGTLAAGTPILLSMSNQIHRISYNRHAGAIDVKRYVRKTSYSLDPTEYSCCVWPRHLPGYQVVSAKFSYPDSGAYNWTYLDSLIAGYAEEELVEGLRYWRTRFVLVPAEGRPPPMRAPSGENLDDEEIRLMGTDRLAELFARARWHRPSASSSERGHHHHRNAPHAVFRFVPTSLDPAASMNDDGFLKQISQALSEDAEADVQRERNAAGSSGGSSSSRRKLLSDQALEQVALDMRSEHNGVKIINDRSWHKILYADTFTGGDLVTWLCRGYADVRTRDEAVEWGARFQREGLFEHVHKSHGFLDGHYFYRLRGPYAPPRSKGWFRSTQTSPAGNLHEKDTSDSLIASAKNSPAKQASTTTAPSRRNAAGSHGETPATPGGLQASSRRSRKIKMSRSTIIDVDPSRKSDRAEVAFLHHDVAHNPANGFNFQIHWLGTTSRFIEDLVQTWTRTVEKYGLRLIEAPIGQIKDVSLHNPFQAPLQIELALAPPPPHTYAHRLPENTPASGYFESALLRRFGFVLDQEAGNRYPNDVEIDYESRPSYFEYSQYVHRSGVAFVQILGGNDGFLWLNNRLFNSHLQPAHKRERERESRGGIRPDSNPNPNNNSIQTSSPPSAEQVRVEFSSFCADGLTLEAFWVEVGAALVKDATQREREKEAEKEKMKESIGEMRASVIKEINKETRD